MPLERKRSPFCDNSEKITKLWEFDDRDPGDCPSLPLMPTTEVPTPPSRTPEPPPPSFDRKRSRHETLEPDELLHLIDKLEDERSRSRWREGIYVSLLAHVVIFLFLLFGPKYILHQAKIISPAEAIKARQKELTYLDLPPDALKRLKPKNPEVMSDQNRVAQSQHPTLDRKTLEQLQAMRRVGPPAPTRQPRAEQQPPTPPALQPQQSPQSAPQQQPAPQQQQPTPAAPQQHTQPLPPTPRPQPEAPTQPPTQPNFNTSQSAGDIIRQAAREARSNGGPSSRDGEYGAGVAPQHPGLQSGVDILSDTMGVDFGPYMKRVIAATQRSWEPLIPESVRPPLLKKGKVGVEFKIMPDGTVRQMILRFPSGDVPLDRAAWGAITGASPYPPLPKDFKGPYLALRFGFYYNITDSVQ